MDPLALLNFPEHPSWPGLATYTVLGTAYLRIRIGPLRIGGEGGHDHLARSAQLPDDEDEDRGCSERVDETEAGGEWEVNRRA